MSERTYISSTTATSQVSPTEVCQLLVFYGVESGQSLIPVRVHDVWVSCNITVLFYSAMIIR